MIATLRGTVTYVHPPLKRGNHLVVEVGAVGYRVEVTGTFVRQAKVGAQLQLYTHLEVREDAQELFGFSSRDELQMFELLITVQRVGPRSALHVMEVVTPLQLRQAVAGGRPEYLVEHAGVSQRLAETLVAGLRGKLEELAAGSGAAHGARGGHAEASEALQALGFSAQDVQRALVQIPLDDDSSEAVIRAALKLLGERSTKPGSPPGR